MLSRGRVPGSFLGRSHEEKGDKEAGAQPGDAGRARSIRPAVGCRRYGYRASNQLHLRRLFLRAGSLPVQRRRHLLHLRGHLHDELLLTSFREMPEGGGLLLAPPSSTHTESGHDRSSGKDSRPRAGIPGPRESLRGPRESSPGHRERIPLLESSGTSSVILDMTMTCIEGSEVGKPSGGYCIPRTSGSLLVRGMNLVDSADSDGQLTHQMGTVSQGSSLF